MGKFRGLQAALVILAIAAAGQVSAETPRSGPSWDFAQGDLRVSSNGRYLVHTNGAQFFWLGDTAWELFHRLNRADAERYLENRRAKGYTVIQAVCLAELDGLNTPNTQGDKPLTNNNPNTPATTSGADPNDATQYDYWDHVDYIVNTAEAKGIYIGMLPTWGDKVVSGVINSGNARNYGRFLGTRYATKRNIIWIIGGDRQAGGYETVWREMAAGIKEGDAGKHLMTYHPPGGHTSATWFHNDSWLNFNMIQTGHFKDTAVWDRITNEYNRTPVKPVLDGEPTYEDHPFGWNPANGYAGAWDVRKYVYWDLFAGAFGHTYGCHNIWQMYAPGRNPVSSAHAYWYDSMDFEGAWDMMHARNLMLSRPFTVRVPDQSILASSAGSGAERVQATRASDGSYLFVYSASGRAFTVNMNKISGATVKGYWYDPRTGSSSSAGQFANTGTQIFSPPTSGTNNDWILVLDNAALNFPPPGVFSGNAIPSVSITSPASNATYQAPASVTINASASDSDGSISKVEFFQNNIKLGEDTSSPYSFTWSNVSAGSYEITARAIDNAGGSAISSAVAISVSTDSAFVKGINLNGSAVTIENNGWIAYNSALGSGFTVTPAPNLTVTNITPSPAVNSEMNAMLNSAIWSTGNLALRQTITNGKYFVYLWVMENFQSNHRSFNVTVEGIQVATSIGSLTLGNWVKYGPYAANVADGALDIGLIKFGGDVHLMGMAIYRETTTPPPPPPGTGSGTILREWWVNISGTAVSDLTSNPAYSGTPAGSEQRTSFEAPTNWADNYGSRMRGYVHAPVTGSYTFWLATDDSGELFLSTTEDSAAKVKIATVNGWAASREWDKFPSQKSTQISLTAGKKYYIEALQKEGTGGDNLAVAWQIPGGTRDVIAGQYLSPFVPTNPPPPPPGSEGKTRVLVLTDMGNEPDDSESMVRFLTYSNEFQVEGLVATTSRFLQTRTNPQLIQERVVAYGQVRNNLLLHAAGYPETQYLLDRVKSGVPKYGMTGVGAGNDSTGSELIISVVDASDPRPVWIPIWGGANTLAQALWKVKNTRTQAQVDAFVAKIRVYSIEDQDDSGSWIRTNFPKLFYIYGWAWQGISSKGGDLSLSNNTWVDQHVQLNHGPLGALYPDIAYIMEGDTPSFLYLIPNGLGVLEHPEYGSWGGRYAFQNGAYKDVNDTWNGETNIWTTVYRWRQAFQNDFQARMDWNIAPANGANHPPVAKFSGNLNQTASSGAVVNLSAVGSSDPDGNSLSYSWMFYDEASSYDGPLAINNSNAQQASFTAPNVAAPKDVHIILTVTDNGTPPLSRYQRIIVTVNPSGNPVVSAGPDRSVTLPSNVSLDGTVSDDGSPGPLTITWSKVSGPGTVSFGNASAVDTSATFSMAGSYVLRLSANDGANTSSDDVTVTVYAQGSTTFLKGINFNGNAVTIEGNLWQSYSQALSSGLNVPAVNVATTNVTPNPSADADTRAMLNSAIWNSGTLAFSQTLTNGIYDLYFWVMENHQSNYRSFDLKLENQIVAGAIGNLSLGGWQKYGPFRTTLADGTLNVELIKVSGDAHIMGLAIYKVSDTPSVPNGNGTGLTGEYFDNIDFTNLKFTQTDATVNFDWGSGSPHASLGADTFSVRWTGQVEARYSQTYTFYTVSDDGVRLWVNGQQIINNWTDHAPTENSGTIALTAGQKVSIKMEVYENGGGAAAKLLWNSSSQAKEVVPQTQLYHSGAGSVTFYRAINLNGPALTIDGNSWEGSTAPNYTYSGSAFSNQSIALTPATDTNRATMIRSSVWNSAGSNVTMGAVPAGVYQVYVYIWEDNGSQTFDLRLEGQVVKSGVVSGGAGSWQRLGPYQVSISDGTINVTCSPGDANLSGIEVWRVSSTQPVAADTSASTVLAKSHIDDNDGDGLLNDYEVANGLNPDSADSDGNGIQDSDEMISGGGQTHIELQAFWLQQQTTAAEAPTAFTVLRLSGLAYSGGSKRDKVSFSGRLPGISEPAAPGTVVIVHVGASEGSFTLGKSATVRSQGGMIKLKWLSKTSELSVQATLKSAHWSADLERAGLVPQGKGALIVPVTVTLNGKAFNAATETSSTMKKGIVKVNK